MTFWEVLAQALQQWAASIKPLPPANLAGLTKALADLTALVPQQEKEQ